MAWIKEVDDDEADGLLKEQFDAAVARAGKVFNIVRVMSQNPPALRDSIGLYLTVMKGDSPLSRSQREMLATVVSATLRCHY